MGATLLGALGTASYRTARWTMAADGRAHETPYAPVATAALAGGVDAATILLTDEARTRHWEPIQRELESLGIVARAERIPAGRDEGEIWAIFGTVDRVLAGAASVVLDVTHAFRHLPLVLFASLTYLTALRDVRVRGVYYGAWDAREGDDAPLLDLAPLLALVQWAFGVRAFRETGNARWLADLVRATRSQFRGRAPGPALGPLESALRELAWTIPAGLPLESGMHARTALGAVAGLDATHPLLAVLRPLVEELRLALSGIALEAPSRDKAAIPLDAAELARQLRLARQYGTWGFSDRALIVLREWLVNCCLLHGGATAAWLERRVRGPMARAIRGVVERRKLGAGSATPAEGGRALAGLWDAIADRRNRVAHAGMVPHQVGANPGDVERLLDECEAAMGANATWDTTRPEAAGRLLVTPLGLSPGVLFTALERLRPDTALVVTSRSARALAGEAIGRAGWRGTPHFREVADAQECFAEVQDVVAWARPHLLAAAEAVVNLTGGTSAMQYLVERIAGEAGRLGVPYQRYALIDRRDAEVQRRDPYVAGDAFPLSGDAPGADDDG